MTEQIMQQVSPPNRNFYTQTFTAELEQIAKVSDLEQRLGKNKSQIIRDAIDAYYQQLQPKAIGER